MNSKGHSMRIFFFVVNLLIKAKWSLKSCNCTEDRRLLNVYSLEEIQQCMDSRKKIKICFDRKQATALEKYFVFVFLLNLLLAEMKNYIAKLHYSF